MRYSSLPCVALALAMLAGCAPAPVAPPLDDKILMPLQARLPKDRRELMATAGADAWNLQQIHATGYHVLGGPGTRTVVAVLDTGADPAQPQLGGHTYPVEDVVGRDVYNSNGHYADFTGVDGNGHGTHVAGIITAVAAGFNVRILPVKVIPNSGVGDDKLLSDGIDRALAWHDPQDNHVRVRVMNLSISSPRPSPRLQAAIQRAVDAGVLVVCASGNEGAAVDFPATLPDVLTVGATTQEDTVADYSCFGPAVDVVAPGGSDEAPIYSTWPTYLTSDDLDSAVDTPHARAGLIGTSMATPHVSAMAGVIWCQHPGLDTRQVRSLLLAMADDLGAPGPDNHYGYGRLNFQRIMGATEHDAH